MIKKILVPVDGSEHASKAIEFAANMAKQSDATMHLLHVVQVTEIPEAIKEFIRSEEIEESPYYVYSETLGRRILSVAEDEANKKGVKHIEASLIQGDPAENIVNFAKHGDFDMIVIGSRGLGCLKGVLLGSVSSKVCHLTDRTCVTVK